MLILLLTGCFILGRVGQLLCVFVVYCLRLVLSLLLASFDFRSVDGLLICFVFALCVCWVSLLLALRFGVLVLHGLVCAVIGSVYVCYSRFNSVTCV